MSILIFISITLFLTCVDIGIKSCVESNIKEGEELDFLDGKVQVRKVYNKGMAMSLFEDKPDFVKKTSAYATAFLTIYMLLTLLKKGNYIKKLGLSLLTAGALGNTFDRFVRGYVVDYIGIRTKFKKLSGLTFNAADVFIVGGMKLIILALLLPGRRKGKTS